MIYKVKRVSKDSQKTMKGTIITKGDNLLSFLQECKFRDSYVFD